MFVYLCLRPDSRPLVRTFMKGGGSVRTHTHPSLSSHPFILLCLPHCSLTNSVFCLNLNLSHSLFINVCSLSRALYFLAVFYPSHFILSLSLCVPSSLALSLSFNLLSMLMDFTAGGHSGLLLKSSVSEMCVIFLLNWIICIYLPPLGPDACLN